MSLLARLICPQPKLFLITLLSVGPFLPQCVTGTFSIICITQWSFSAPATVRLWAECFQPVVPMPPVSVKSHWSLPTYSVSNVCTMRSSKPMSLRPTRQVLLLCSKVLGLSFVFYSGSHLCIGYAAACAAFNYTNITTAFVALHLAPGWDGPFGLGLNLVGTVFSVGAAFILGMSSLLLLSNLS